MGHNRLWERGKWEEIPGKCQPILGDEKYAVNPKMGMGAQIGMWK
jgi:hypothetical protein